MDERDIGESLSSPDPERRLEAIRVVSELRLFAFESRVLVELQSEDPRIAAAAAHALVALSDAQSAGMLVSMFGQLDPTVADELNAVLGAHPKLK